MASVDKTVVEVVGKNKAEILKTQGGREGQCASDVDFIVDIEPGKSLLDLGRLLMDLQELLGCSVDIVTEQGLKARLHDPVL